jgi:glucose/arabinose dehydrogenase
MKKAPLLILVGVALMACTPADESATTTATTETTTTTTEPMPPPASTTPAPPSTDPAADTCNMAQYASLVGQPSTDAGVPPASATVRIIRPGDQVTMDFQATRLNIEVGADGMITAVRCG